MATSPRQSAERDYFTDRSVLLDPYDFFEGVRARGPVAELEARDALLVTGFDECVEVLLNKEDFSSALATNPLAPLPFAPEGDDIAAQIDAYARAIRPQDLLVNYDGEFHAAARSLLNPLFVPSRLKANEAFMHDLADRMAREMVGKGGGEIIAEVATPYVTLVIADLLGVPAEDRQQFREAIDTGGHAGDIDNPEAVQGSAALIFMGTYFFRYLSERRAAPRDDVMTLLANARFPDGSIPDIVEPAKAAMFLFAAGQDTSAKLLGNSMRYLAENTAMQDRLRADRALIPAFMEEMLRLEGSTKATFRIAVRKTRIGDVEVPAGKRVVVGLAAANR
ncbi:MAG TPA: cytochrome P450, partial [Novosphingobium sp.]